MNLLLQNYSIADSALFPGLLQVSEHFLQVINPIFGLSLQ
jgi:hypothetical protein